MYKRLRAIIAEEKDLLKDIQLEDEIRVQDWRYKENLTKMYKNRFLDLLKPRENYIIGFIDALIEMQGLSSNKEIISKDLAHNIKSISEREMPYPEGYSDMFNIPMYLNRLIANRNMIKEYSKSFISRWEMYNELFSQGI